jgi:hypothetical protein
MNALRSLTAAACLAPLAATAQLSAVQRIGSTLSAAPDFNGDLQRDLVLFDMPTGTLRIGTVTVNLAYDWVVRDTGLASPDLTTAMAVLPAFTSNVPDIVLTSPAFNQVRIIPYNGNPDTVFAPDGPEPQCLAPVPPAAPGLARGIFVGRRSGAGSCHAFTATPPWNPLWSTAGSEACRDGNPFSFAAADGTHPGFLTAKQGQPATLHVLRASGATQGTDTKLPSLPEHSRWASRIYAGTASVFLWQPDTNPRLSIYPTSFSAPNYLFGSPGVHDLGLPISHVFPIENAAGHDFAITFTDASVRIYRFQPANPAQALTLVQDLGKSGGPVTAIVPSGTGNAGAFLILRRDANGKETMQRQLWNGASYQTFSAPSPPALPSGPLSSNVLFFEKEPLVNPQPAEVQRRRVGDWTVSITPALPNRTVNFRTDLGPVTGLSSTISSTTVPTPSPAAFTLANQIDDQSSVSLISGATPGPLAPPVFSPPPGTQEAPAQGSPFTVTISPATPGTLWVDNGGGVFTPSPTGTSSLNGPATVRAFIRSGTSQSPIATATYSFATPGNLTAPAITDANLDGVSDAWANLTGATNPNADDDGDGFLNFAEYSAGTDPGNPLSKPIPAPVPQLLAEPGPGKTAVLTWISNDPAVILQSSTDLVTWTVQTTGIITNGSRKSFTAPPASPSQPNAYWRLRR